MNTMTTGSTKSARMPSRKYRLLPGAAASAIVCATLAFALPAVAADLEQGRVKAEQICAACHGRDGNTPIDPGYPRLAGQYREYLQRALVEYKHEDRKNPIMGAQAKLLSDADMENLAAYYASLPGSLEVRSPR